MGENSYGRGSSYDYLAPPSEYFDWIQNVSVTYLNPSNPTDPDNGTRSFSRVSARSLRAPYTWNPPQDGTSANSYEDSFGYPSPQDGKFCAMLFGADGFGGSGAGYDSAADFRQVPTRPAPILIFGSDQTDLSGSSLALSKWFGLTFRLSLAKVEASTGGSPTYESFGGTQYGAVQVAARWQAQNFQSQFQVTSGQIFAGVGPLPDPFNWRDIRGSYSGGLNYHSDPIGWSFVF